MALKGSKNDRHEIRNALDRKLWAGNVNDAVIYLKNLDHKFIKNTQHLEDAIEYLETAVYPLLCVNVLIRLSKFQQSRGKSK